MSSYKLDYVSGYFIGDAVTKIEHKINEAGQDVTAVYTGNTMGLDVGSYMTSFNQPECIFQSTMVTQLCL